MSKFGQALSKALDRPEDWFVVDRYTMKHKPSGVEFWIANGGFFFDAVHSNCEKAGLVGCLERHWLYRKAMNVKYIKTHDRVLEKKFVCAVNEAA